MPGYTCHGIGWRFEFLRYAQDKPLGRAEITPYDIINSQMAHPEADSITFPCRTILDVDKYIIGDARQRVCSLDWPHFGLTQDEAGRHYDFAFPVILTNKSVDCPGIAVSTVKDSEENNLRILSGFPQPAVRPLRYHDHRLLCMRESPISPEKATFTRDWLWAKAPEFIAELFLRKSIPEVMDYFVAQDPVMWTHLMRRLARELGYKNTVELV